MTDLSKFRFSRPIEVRYADIDAFQHVNNAKFFTYMETVRIQYMKDVVGFKGGLLCMGIILAHAACDFRVPILIDDPVRVYVRASRLGTKSFDFEYAIVVEHTGEDPQIAAQGISTQVAYDYDTGASMAVPASWRETMLSYEPFLTDI